MLSRSTTWKVAVAATTTSLALLGGTSVAGAATPDTATTALGDAEPFPYPDAELTLVNHRGLSPGFPENTPAAFANAVAMGVDAIEIDLRPTSDRHVVILHDSTVDRTTDGTGPVAGLTLAQVKALDAGSYVGPQFAGERIPTFEEALGAVEGTGVRLLLDIKDATLIPEIVHLVEAHDMASQVIVGPRSVAALNDFKALNSELLTLGFIPNQADADAFVAAGVDYIRLWPEWIEADAADPACQADYAARVAAFQRGERATPGAASCQIQHLAEQGVPVWSTVDDLPYATMDDIFRLGATGLLSDLPADLDQLLDDIEVARAANAGPRIDALAAEAATLPSGAGAVTGALSTARSALEAGRPGDACAAMTDARAALHATGLPASTIGDLVIEADRIAAVLACTRFGTEGPDPVVPEAPIPVLMSLLGAATFGGVLALRGRRRPAMA